MIVFGLISSVFDLLTFGLLLYIFEAGQGVFQTSWFMISLLTELAVVLVLRTRSRPSQPSQPLAALGNPCRRGGRLRDPLPSEANTIFGFVPLSARELAAVLAIVGGYILATEIAKPWFFRHEHAARRATRVT